MRELDRILYECERAAGTFEGVLATIVHVKGSAYRRPGARMLLRRDGVRIGSISGGCLEGEIARKAWWLTEAGGPVVRVYDTSSGEEAVWEFGLGCNGVVEVMLERTESPATRDLLAFLDVHRASRTPAAVATVVRGSAAPVGGRLWTDASKILGGSLMGGVLEAPLLAQLCAAMDEERSRFVHIAGAEVFVEFFGPALEVVIFGAGHDAIPLTEIAHRFGWRVTVADGRPAYATADRFREADLVVVLRAGELLSNLAIGSRTAVVMMTHNYPMDERLLPHILAAGPWYIGILGPRSRTESLFQGGHIPANVHAPVGLDLGGETPVSVAVSIASEIQAALHDRGGGMLRERQGSIHAAPRETGPVSLTRDFEYERLASCESITLPVARPVEVSPAL